MMAGVSTDRSEDEDVAAFGRIFEALYDDIVRFVQRRAPAESVDDIVADTFLVAWRRITDLPHELDEARPWLFTVARHTLANSHRGRRRFANLALRIAAQPDHRGDDTAGIALRLDVAEAFRRLRQADQEALALVAWDGLRPAEAARVLGVSPSTFGARLSRARARLRAHLTTNPHQGGRHG